MDILRDDLFRNKYFLVTLSVVAIISAVIYVIHFNSVESRCQRYVQKMGIILGAGGNKLRDLQLQKASEPLIQDCIKRGGSGGH